MIRQRRSTPRRGPLRDSDYRRWLMEEGKCRACQMMLGRGGDAQLHRAGTYPGQCAPAHTSHNGMSSKGDDSGCAPLCWGFGTPDHHGQYDGRVKLPNGEYGNADHHGAFERYYGYSVADEARAHWAAFQILQEEA